MRDTLRVNDRILVEKWSYWFGDIQRGDIVVFDDPANWLGEEDAKASSNVITKVLSTVGLYPTGGHLVKRVIGVGGDEVACVDGKVEVNGVNLHEEDYVTLSDQACDGDLDVTVPDGPTSGCSVTTASTPPTPACTSGILAAASSRRRRRRQGVRRGLADSTTGDSSTDRTRSTTPRSTRRRV